MVRDAAAAVVEGADDVAAAAADEVAETVGVDGLSPSANDSGAGAVINEGVTAVSAGATATAAVAAMATGVGVALTGLVTMWAGRDRLVTVGTVGTVCPEPIALPPPSAEWGSVGVAAGVFTGGVFTGGGGDERCFGGHSRSTWAAAGL